MRPTKRHEPKGDMPQIEAAVSDLRKLLSGRDGLLWLVALRRVVYEVDGGSQPASRGYHRGEDMFKVSD